MVRVFVVAISRAERAGLRSMLESADVRVVGEAPTLEGYAPSDVDVIVTADDDALKQVERALRSAGRTFAVVVLSDDPHLVAALRDLPLGGWAIVPREASSDELRAAVAAAAQGLVALPPSFLSGMIPDPRRATVGPSDSDETLSARELEVLGLLSQGLSNKLIAGRLGISEHTVKYHVSSIYSKLGAASRTEAVSIGARRGLVSL